LKSIRKVLYVELEFSTSENLLVKKLKLKIKEDSLLSLYYKSPNTVGTFFCLLFSLYIPNLGLMAP
jgi:hypothetical protein